MKKLTTILILFLIALNAFSTNQNKDILIMQSDTLYLYESPLEKVDSISEKIRQKMEEKFNDYSLSTGCWRGYSAKWILKENILYLAEVEHCTSNRIINDLVEQILGKKFKNGLIRADWVNGIYWCGKDIAPALVFSTSIYYNEFRLNFRNGFLTDIKEKSYIPCEYSNKDKLLEFILTRMDFSKLPDLKNKNIELSAWVRINQTGQIIKVVSENSSNSDFNSEFVRVIKQIPCMPVYFNEGEFFDASQTISILINKTTINKYVR